MIDTPNSYATCGCECSNWTAWRSYSHENRKIWKGVCSVLLVTVASVLVLHGEPIAGGSGIPEVKTYLQGCRVPRMLRISTLCCKAPSIIEERSF